MNLKKGNDLTMKAKLSLRQLKGAGYLVVTKSGRPGCTFRSEGQIKNKVPVHLQLANHPLQYSDKAILCNLETLIIVGFID
jgi:hypothetical protein